MPTRETSSFNRRCLMQESPHPNLPSDFPPTNVGGTASRSLEMGTRVTVTLPREVNVRLVEVNSLHEYEVWTWVTSLLVSPVTAYFVAYCQSGGLHLLMNACVFGLLFLIALGRTVCTRCCLTKRGAKIRCKDPLSPDNLATASRCLGRQTPTPISVDHLCISPSRPQGSPAGSSPPETPS